MKQFRYTHTAIAALALASSCSTVPKTLLINTNKPGATITVEGTYIGSGKATIAPTKPTINGVVELEDHFPLPFTVEVTKRSKVEQYEAEQLALQQKSQSSSRSGSSSAASMGLLGVAIASQGSTKSPLRSITPLTIVSGGAAAVIGALLPINYIDSNGRMASNVLTKNLLIFVGLGVGAFGGFTLPSFMPQDFYPPVYLDIARQYVYDERGYHKTTGLDRYGVTKDGRFPDGSRFSGRVVQGKKEGAGTWTSADGFKTLTGTFTADLAEGLGIERVASGSTLSFFGTYQKGLRNGVGIEFDAQGKPERLTRYATGGKVAESTAYTPEPVIGADRGYFLGAGIQNGLAEGAGKVLSLDGRVSQEGTFRQGYLVSGKKTLPDGGVQQGNFTMGQLTQGNWRRSNGTAAEGTWVDDRVQSPAKLWSSNGDVYTGPFDSSLRPSGSGSMAYASGDSYRGNFLDGRPQGNGTYTFKNGDSYSGEFQNGTFSGQGKLVRKSGETIEGGFKNGVPHGLAIYKLGSVVERAEYYEGARIDQAFQMRQAAERERMRQEEERLAAEHRRREEEDRKKREAEEQEEREYEAYMAQRSPDSNFGPDLLDQLQQTTSDFSAWADQNSAEFDATLKSIDSYNQSVREANAKTSSGSSYPSYSSGSSSSSGSYSSSSASSSSSGSGSSGHASTAAAPAPSYQAPSSSGSFGGGASSSSSSASASAAKPAAGTKDQRWNTVVSSFGTINFPVRLDPARQVGNYNKHSMSLPLTIGPRRGQFGTPATIKVEWDLYADPNTPNSFIRIWVEQNKSTLFVGNQQYSVPSAGLESSIVPSLGQGQTVEISFDVFDATDSRLGRLSVQDALLGARPSVGKLLGYLRTKLENSGQLAKGATIQGPLKIGNVEVTGISFTQSQYNAFLTHYKQGLMATW